MNIDGEAASAGDAPEHVLKLLHLIWLQGCGVVLLVLSGELSHLGQKLSAELGEVQLVTAAVRPAAPTFDQPAGLQPVQNRDDPARPDAHVLAHRSLADPGVAADEPKHSRIRGSDAQRPQCLFEPARGVRTELGEQESDSMVARGRHASMIDPLTYSSCCVSFLV